MSEKLVNELELYFSTDHLVVVRLSPAFQTESGEPWIDISTDQITVLAALPDNFDYKWYMN